MEVRDRLRDPPWQDQGRHLEVRDPASKRRSKPLQSIVDRVLWIVRGCNGGLLGQESRLMLTEVFRVLAPETIVTVFQKCPRAPTRLKAFTAAHDPIQKFRIAVVHAHCEEREAGRSRLAFQLLAVAGKLERHCVQCCRHAGLLGNEFALNLETLNPGKQTEH